VTRKPLSFVAVFAAFLVYVAVAQAFSGAVSPPSPLIVRDGTSEGDSRFPTAQAGRDGRRRSLNYFAQLTDFQLADEESPARVEFADQGDGDVNAAWRPQEALQPFMIEYSLRRVNQFAGASPIPQGDGTRAAMDFALMTGDQADNMQRNEIVWTRELLEGGGSVSFNSGSTNPADYDATLHPSCLQYGPTPEHLAEALRYTGVQDFDDYDEGANPYYYDPDDVRGYWDQNGWPTYTGLMDRAQASFDLDGLSVPSYVTNGNHDALVQGNQAANKTFEDIATGCQKALGSTQSVTSGSDGPNPEALLDPTGETSCTAVTIAPCPSMLVPPDEQRQFVDRAQIKQIYGVGGATGDHDNAHGYDFVDPAENAASDGAASYYAWNPPQAPGFRYISIDTNSEGGVVPQSASGNIDHPQYQWLKNELTAAQSAGKLIVVFGHHPVRTLTSTVADEEAGGCTVDDRHGHDVNPGCDRDPRSSEPLHLGDQGPESLVDLLAQYDNVLAYVPGHTHEHKILPCGRTAGCPAGHAWWEINTSATADWPSQHRLIEIMDNRDGTFSIFGTVLDEAANVAAPASESNASTFTSAELAAIDREFAYNDPQLGVGTGEGEQKDRNVELLIKDPRKGDISVKKSDSPDPVHIGKTLTYTIQVAHEGGGQASGVTLADPLPSRVAYQSASSSQGTCSQKAGKVTCSLGTMTGLQVVTVTIVVKPKQKGTATNTASITYSPTPDRDPSNDSATTTTTIIP
jgi:uncharacterized repeat protein (TIGR01451 family)